MAAAVLGALGSSLLGPLLSGLGVDEDVHNAGKAVGRITGGLNHFFGGGKRCVMKRYKMGGLKKIHHCKRTIDAKYVGRGSAIINGPAYGRNKKHSSFTSKKRGGDIQNTSNTPPAGALA